MISAAGCFSFKDAGHDLGKGLGNSLKPDADTMGYNAVKGMRESLTNKESQRQLKELIDSLVTVLGKNTNKQITGIRDSIFNEKITNWLRNDLLGNSTAARLVYLRNSVLDSELKKYFKDLTKGLVAGILNDSSLVRIGAARDTLIGSRSNQLIKAIVDSAMISISSNINTRINPLLRENLSFVEKNAAWLIILIAFFALLIVWFVWKQKEKYLGITKMLTYQISELPDKNLKENLKGDISRNAKTIGIEDELRKLLDKYGLLHQN